MWPTRDKVIPKNVFYQFLAAMRNNSAAEQLTEVQAVAHGISVALEGKDYKVKRMTRVLAKLAYPEE